MVSEREIDVAVDLYLEMMENGDPRWKEAEELAARLIQQRYLEEEC